MAASRGSLLNQPIRWLCHTHTHTSRQTRSNQAKWVPFLDSVPQTYPRVGLIFKKAKCVSACWTSFKNTTVVIAARGGHIETSSDCRAALPPPARRGSKRLVAALAWHPMTLVALHYVTEICLSRRRVCACRGELGQAAGPNGSGWSSKARSSPPVAL